MHKVLCPDDFDFSNLSPQAISEVLARHQLNLSVDEALTIQFKLLHRPPTYAECVLWAIQGSEHCSYKSSRSHLAQFNTNSPDVILGPKEDAGIVAVARDAQGKRYGVVISHESHNHPSQIVPYEGAATGVGGNVRDVCCMGAEVIAIANGLRMGDLSQSRSHFIYQGVVEGIGGYGNPLGVPTLAGDLYFNAGYNDNCLVTVVTLGVVREEDIIHSKAPPNSAGYAFILVGKPTDNSGFGGASFASSALQSDAETKHKGAVQEPNAFLQRHLLKANYALFEWLKQQQHLSRVGFKDLGAGGVACASIELAEGAGLGAHVAVEQIPTTMPHLNPAILLCAETQERFMWVVPPDLIDPILQHYNERFALPSISVGAKAAVIGHIREDTQYVVNYHDQVLVDAETTAITQGLRYDRPFIETVKNLQEPNIPLQSNYNDLLMRLLAHENIASRACVYETFDKQVQGRTVLEAGSADAGVLQPFNDDSYPAEIRQTGIALALDHNPRINQIDAYWGAVNAVLEAARNVVAVGATPVALTDCLCFGNPEKPDQFYAFVESIRGIRDACAAIRLYAQRESTLPIIAGNVSLYNESRQGKSIPPSPMISCLGVLPDVQKAITYSLKSAHSILILIGERLDECGGSIYYELHDALGEKCPKPDLATISSTLHAIHTSIASGLVLAAHDISEGGLAVALAEMCFTNQIGVKATLHGDLRIDKQLFSETGGFILEIARDKLKAFRQVLFDYQVSHSVLGETTISPRIQINAVIDVAVSEAHAAWQNGLRARII